MSQEKFLRNIIVGVYLTPIRFVLHYPLQEDWRFLWISTHHASVYASTLHNNLQSNGIFSTAPAVAASFADRYLFYIFDSFIDLCRTLIERNVVLNVLPHVIELLECGPNLWPENISCHNQKDMAHSPSENRECAEVAD